MSCASSPVFRASFLDLASSLSRFLLRSVVLVTRRLFFSSAVTVGRLSLDVISCVRNWSHLIELTLWVMKELRLGIMLKLISTYLIRKLIFFIFY